MIRAATPADMPALLEMGRAFHAETGHEKANDFCTFDPGSFEKTLAILGQAGLLLVKEIGGEAVAMAGTDVAPTIYNHDVLLGREVFWYAAPAFRKGLGRDLLAGLEEIARGRGARLFYGVAESGARSTALARIYTGRGYNLAETSFCKRL